MSYSLTNNKHPKEIIKGPLSFVVGNVRVVVFNDSESHSIQPCLQSGLKKKSNPSASKNDVKAALDLMKVQKIIPSSQKKKPNV